MPQLTKTELQWLALAARHMAETYEDLVSADNETEAGIFRPAENGLLTHYIEVYRSLCAKIEQIAQSEAKIIKIQR